MQACLALEAAVAAEDAAAKRILADRPEPDVTGIPAPPVDVILIRKPPPVTSGGNGV